MLCIGDEAQNNGTAERQAGKTIRPDENGSGTAKLESGTTKEKAIYADLGGFTRLDQLSPVSPRKGVSFPGSVVGNSLQGEPVMRFGSKVSWQVPLTYRNAGNQ